MATIHRSWRIAAVSQPFLILWDLSVILEKIGFVVLLITLTGRCDSGLI